MTQFKGCLKGSSSPTEAARIIEFLTRLGGVNKYGCYGTTDHLYYIIDANGNINTIDNPRDYTLITLQPDVLLPVSWCVADCESVRKYVNPVSNCKFYGENTNYITTDGFRTIGADKPFGILLTEPQFLALTAPSGKEEREIEGYVCPMDYYGGKVKKGTVVKTDANKNVYWDEQNYMFPAEIVETWEPKYKEVRRPLFTTEDGVEVFEGGGYFLVRKGTYSIIGDNWAYPNEQRNNESFWYFSTKQAAENYIVENKPCLNWDEAMDWFEENKRMSAQTAGDALKKIIQSKIKW